MSHDSNHSDTQTDSPSLNYRDAGVDIVAGNELVERIKPIAQKTFREGVLTGLGGFGALFELPVDRYRKPVLVSGTDGVGTKLKLAMMMNKHDTIGIDLVAMCVNDLIVGGAEPLYFLDYYASGSLDVETATAVMQGIGQGCELAGAALTGGETAEMPGMYAKGDYDLAGFCVGIVEKEDIIDGSKVKPDDVLIGLASSGPHSNGYSLIRKVLDHANADLQENIAGRTLGEHLLEPTRIYVKSLLKLFEQVKVHALAHITGGGLTENLPRVLPQNTCATIDLKSWKQPVVFDWLQQQGNIKRDDMLVTFNCGVGMVLCVAVDDVKQTLSILNQAGEQAWIIGAIKSSTESDPYVEYQ